MSTEEEEFVLKEFANIIDYAMIWHKEQRKITKNTKSKIVDYSFTQKTFILDDAYDAILAIFLGAPSITVKALCNFINPTWNKNDYRKMRRMVNKILSLGLIEKVMDDSIHIGNMGKGTVPYRLTLIGIIYIITNHELEIFSMIDPFMRIISDDSYSSNILFQRFLYPYFRKQTLQLEELRAEFLDYLDRICNRIKEHLDFYYMWYKPDSSPNSLIENKYILKQLFIWNKLDDGKDDIKRLIVNTLRNYLYEQFQWTWILKASFKLDYENNLIELLGENKEYSRIQISRLNQIVFLKYNGNTYESVFRMDPKKTHTVILGKGETLKEKFDPGLLFDCPQELLALLFSIQSRFIANEEIKQVLSNDPIYRKTVDEMINLLKIKD